jgi:hypothetical protein
MNSAVSLRIITATPLAVSPKALSIHAVAQGKLQDRMTKADELKLATGPLVLGAAGIL